MLMIDVNLIKKKRIFKELQTWQMENFTGNETIIENLQSVNLHMRSVG